MHFSLMIAFFSVYLSIFVFYQKKFTWYHLKKINTFLADMRLMPNFLHLIEKINVYFTKLFSFISVYMNEV